MCSVTCIHKTNSLANLVLIYLAIIWAQPIFKQASKIVWDVHPGHRWTERYLFLETICALLAFSLQQAASALRPWVGVGHDNLVTMDHALVAVVLGVGGRKGGLMGWSVGGMGVVLWLISRWRQGHG